MRNQSNKGVNVSTVLSSKSYWHFQLTVFPLMYIVTQSPAAHQVPEAGPGHFWSQAQNLEGFAHTVKLILNYCCSKIKTTGGTLCLHFSAKHLNKLYTQVGDHFL